MYLEEAEEKLKKRSVKVFHMMMVDMCITHLCQTTECTKGRENSDANYVLDW